MQESTTRPTSGDTDCNVESAIRMIGGKWKLLVLRLLLKDGPQRFNAIGRAIPDVSHKVLTENLRQLEGEGLLERVEVEGWLVYEATPSGQRLFPILHALGEWLDQHRS